MSGDPYLPGHGDDAYTVTHYDVSLSYAVHSNQLEARATVSVTALRETSTLRLDLHGLQVTKVLVAGQRAPRYTHRQGALVVQLTQALHEGEAAEVTVRYRGKPGVIRDLAGEAGWEELSDGSLVVGQPGGTPAWVPCNDRPDIKATWSFEVTTGHDYHVVANGQRLSRRRGSSSTTWVYEMTQPMPTYLASLQIGPYVETEQEASVPMFGVLPANLVTDYTKHFDKQPAMLDFFVERFGPYPFASYRAVVTDEDLEIPLEASSFSTFGTNFLSNDWDAQRLIAHELSHQWFGNSLTLGVWRDIWLHEGFACYAEWLWSEEIGKDSCDKRAQHHYEKLSKLPQDLVLTDPGPRDMFDDRIYKRGALTLHALRLKVGDDAFFGLVKDWATTHAHSTVDTAQFTAFATMHTGVDLSELFTAWLDEMPLPSLGG